MNAVEEYISRFDEPVQERLYAIRRAVMELVSDAEERMCMGIPTYDRNGKWLVHFAAFKKHIGFYPDPDGIQAFQDKLAGYKTSKGTVQFPLDQPLPVGLIREMIEYRAKAQKGN